jgi:hypothetical protein
MNKNELDAVYKILNWLRLHTEFNNVFELHKEACKLVTITNKIIEKEKNQKNEKI